eukprot:3248255-Rhodomonas_salina.1
MPYYVENHCEAGQDVQLVLNLQSNVSTETGSRTQCPVNQKEAVTFEAMWLSEEDCAPVRALESESGSQHRHWY